MNITDTELAYIAGIVDGEGSICITTNKHMKRPYYALRLTVANTNKELIEWLYSTLGGHLQKRPHYPMRLPAWQLTISGDEAAHWLGILLPYLRVKKLQAETALNFQANKARRMRRERSMGEEIVEETQKILMCNLNHGREGL